MLASISDLLLSWRYSHHTWRGFIISIVLVVILVTLLQNVIIGHSENATGSTLSLREDILLWLWLERSLNEEQILQGIV